MRKVNRTPTTSQERIGKLYSWGIEGPRPLSKEYLKRYDEVFNKSEQKERWRLEQDARAAEAKAEKERLMELVYG